MKPKKQANIPEKATWNKVLLEWELGSVDAKGKKTGEWKQWRVDGSLCSVTNYENSTNLTFVRYHEDGSFSQKGFMKDDKFQGVLTYQISENPTTEWVNLQQNQMHSDIFSWKMFYNKDGKKSRAGAFFNKNKEEISIKGVLKPKNIPKEAVSVKDGNWRLEIGKLDILNQFNGVLGRWNAQGELIGQFIYETENSKLQKTISFHSDGSIFEENNFETLKGYQQKSINPFTQNPAIFNENIYKVTYDFTIKNATKGSISPSNTKFFNQEGNELVPEGTAKNEKQIPNTDGKNVCTYEAEFSDFSQKEGVIIFRDDTSCIRYEVEYSQNKMKNLKVYDESAKLITEETFYLGKNINDMEFVKSLKIYNGKKVQEFIHNEEGFCVTINHYKSGNLTSTLTNSDIKENLSPKEFKKAFKERYTSVKDYTTLFINHYFDVRDNKVYSKKLNDEYFKVMTLAKDFGGNTVILILEPGEHYGKVYDNDHETGLFDMSCINEYIEELIEDGEIENEDVVKTMDKTKLIELMPFYRDETKLVDNLNELMKSVYICSDDTYGGTIREMEQIITEK